MTKKKGLFKWLSFKSKNTETEVGYVLDGEPQTEKELKQVFTAFEIEHLWEITKPLIRKSIHLSLTLSPDKAIKTGRSKIGGSPDLVEGFHWPKSPNGKLMTFVTQINFRDIEFNNEILPVNGILFLFVDPETENWEYGSDMRKYYQVFFSTTAPQNKTNDKKLLTDKYFKSATIEFSPSLSIPGPYHYYMEKKISDVDFDNYYETSSRNCCQILGYPDEIQNPMELECESEYLNDQNLSSNSIELQQIIESWVLLLQIDTDELYDGGLYDELGTLYLWIKKEDLINLNFDNCVLIFQNT